MKASRSARLGAAILVTCACGSALAAGGHHAVDDAAILSRGECEGETWFSGEAGGRRLLHAGTNCRVGPSNWARRASTHAATAHRPPPGTSR